MNLIAPGIFSCFVASAPFSRSIFKKAGSWSYVAHAAERTEPIMAHCWVATMGLAPASSSVRIVSACPRHCDEKAT